jgi:ubiquinone/menaquinone biosynthesis C-methylase UbiE
MSIQNSKTTKKMFDDNDTLWHEYHDKRDHSFKGYDKQEEIPINKIISYLETKKNYKIKILDLGCGRNLIRKHFKNNENFNIKGYDYISHNKSIKCDISELHDEDGTIDICIFSQSLMGSNWKEYIKEAKRVLRYNGEIIISESIERYEIIKEYIEEIKLHIKMSENKKTDKWFYLYIIND